MTKFDVVTHMGGVCFYGVSHGSGNHLYKGEMCEFCFRMCFGFDIDADALNTCRHNVEEFELNSVEIVQLDIRKCTKAADNRFVQMFDTVVMNPPFGTRQQGYICIH